jgi:outer membrane protein assembly factor BamB
MKILFPLILTVIFSLSALSAKAERLVLVGASYGKNILAITDAKGDVLWSHKTAGPQRGHTGHHDVHLLPNGNILFHDSWTTLKEITLDKKVVWEYDCAKSNGNQGKRVDVHAFARLPNGNTRIVESSVGRVIEVDKEGKVVWDYLIKTRVYGAMRLKNGNTLIASGSGNSVVEVSPEKKVVWEIKGKVPGTEVNLKWMTCLQERENGNFIVGNCHAGPDNPQIFEITREKKIVWEFNEYELVGNGLACWQVIEGEQAAGLRKKLVDLKK